MFDDRAPRAVIVLCLLLAASAVGFRGAAEALDVYLRKEPIELRRSLEAIPRTLGPWRTAAEGDRLDAAMVEELGTDLYLNRTLVRTEDGVERPETAVALHLAYYTGMIDAVPHVPDRCGVAAGLERDERPRNVPMTVTSPLWRTDPELVNLATDRPYPVATRTDRVTGVAQTVPLPVGDYELRLSRMTDSRDPDAGIWAGYFFIANGRLAATPEQVKLLAFRPSERYAYYCKVQVIARGEGLDEAAFIARVEDLLVPLIPEIMACLPDWSEVERRDRDASTDAQPAVTE